MLFHNISRTGISSNQIDPFVPFLQLLTVKEDAISLLGRERKAELAQSAGKLFSITHGYFNVVRARYYNIGLCSSGPSGAKKASQRDSMRIARSFNSGKKLPLGRISIHPGHLALQPPLMEQHLNSLSSLNLLCGGD